MGELIPFPARPPAERFEASCPRCGTHISLTGGAEIVTLAAMTCPCGGTWVAKPEGNG